MKPVMQTKFGDVGNCFAAVLASLYGVEIDTVEHIVDGDRGWLDRLETWLNSRGLSALFVSGDCIRLPNVLHIACGPTHRGGHYHAVIYHGDTLVHDPHPDGEGLAEISERLFFMATSANFAEVGRDQQI
jgi:hypothetical protein